MANQQSSAIAGKSAHRSISRKKLPVLPRHVRFRAWVRRRGRQFVHGWWAWELIAATVSMTAMMVLIALLKKADQRRQQNWTVGNTQLTFNTIVVAIGTVIRSSLLLVVAGALNQNAWNWFASRTKGAKAEGQPLKDLETFSEAAANSWNCLRLLWRTKGRYIISIGALIMILSIAFDTFVQQVLTIEIQPQEVKLSGANLTAENILPSIVSYLDKGMYGNEDTSVLRFESLITNGFLETNTTLPSANCPTSNCTWPVTPTIGVCNECTHVDATVTTTSNSSCNSTVYTLPPLLGLQVQNSSLTMATCRDLNESNWKLESEYWPLELNDPGRGRNTTIANFYSYGMPTTDFTDGSRSPFIAYKCSFFFCVQGYSASSTFGKMSQQPISTNANQSHWTSDKNDGWWVFDDVPPELNAESTAVFRVNEETRQNIGTVFPTVLSGNVVSQIGRTIASSLPSGPVADLFWRASGSLANLTVLVQGVSDSLTTYMRTAASETGPDARFAPTVGMSVPVVGVRWAWLAYPLALLFSGLVFLGMTIRATHRRRVRPWKGHRVPLLLAHLDESVRVQAQGGLTHRTGLDDRVGTLRVRLEFDGDNGIVFRRVYNQQQP